MESLLLVLSYPNINPNIIDFGLIKIRWYGLMYVVGFVLAFFVMNYASKIKKLNYSKDDISDFITYMVLGVILGGRLGYILFYNLQYYVANPIEMIMINKGGMSFHGGLIGCILSGTFFSLKKKKDFFELSDMATLTTPLGLFFGRIGNFINGELYGRVSSPSFPLAMVFPSGGDLPRHPSQLYEAFFEGIVLFLILFLVYKKTDFKGLLLGFFIFLYGFFRFFLEYFREPDAHLGFVFLSFSMGQVLCFFMIIIGILYILFVSSTSSKKYSESIHNNRDLNSN